jgi:hypothetical protein
MKKRIVLVIGILGILLSVGAISLAMAQNQSSSKTKDTKNHECTPEMMGNMTKNCPRQMMQPGKHGKMMKDREISLPEVSLKSEAIYCFTLYVKSCF